MKLTYTPIRPEAARSGAAIQAPFASLATISAALDEDNLAPEGIDRRLLGAQPVWSIVGSLLVGTRPAASLAASAPKIQLVHDGTALRLSFTPLSAGNVIAADEAIRLRSWIRFSSSVSAGLGLEGKLSTAWYTSILGGTLVVGSNAVLERKDRGTWGHARNNHGVIWNECVLVGPLTLDWAEIRYDFTASGAPEAFPDRSILWATKYKRWST